ncbi:MAG: DUF58 domain-containing protein [Pseudomonadota bacterium]
MPVPPSESQQDPRIRVDMAGLQRLGSQAQALSFLPRPPARSILNGRHGSKLRGRGLNFEELREYVDGDDIRTIDWKVTARTRVPHVRVYSEERDRPTLLLVDQRMSMFFGSILYMKSVVAAEAAALTAHRVLAQGDRVGGLVFGDDLLAEHRPQRSRRALEQFLQSVAKANGLLRADAPVTQSVSINRVLRAAVRIAKSNTSVLIFSDFDGIDGDTEKLVATLAQANDMIVLNVSDAMVSGLPDGLKLTVTDGGLQAQLDTDAVTSRRKIEAFIEGRITEVATWSRKYGFPLLPLTTSEPALGQIQRLLGHRARR